tara:strand:+ start:391 stop:570 length:180 start_codon:yes stop_codon:yes gene_type:complete
MLINSSLGRNTLGFNPSLKNFERLGLLLHYQPISPKILKNLCNTHSEKKWNDRNRQMIF